MTNTRQPPKIGAVLHFPRATSATARTLPGPPGLGRSIPTREDAPAVAARRGRAYDIRARVRREERAAVLIRRGQTGLSDKAESALTTAQKHCGRALDRHDKLSEAHVNLGQYLSDLGALHRKLTSTLRSLGFADHSQISRHMAAFDSHVRAAKGAFEDSEDSHVNIGDHVMKADKHVRSVLTGAVQSEPLADEGSADKEHDSAEDRTARGRRIKLRLS